MGQRFAGKLRKAQLVLQACGFHLCGFHLDDDLLEELLAFNLELAEKKSGRSDRCINSRKNCYRFNRRKPCKFWDWQSKIANPKSRIDIRSWIPKSRGIALPCPYATMQPEDRNFGQPIAGTLSTIVGSFKSAATKQINPPSGLTQSDDFSRRSPREIVRNLENSSQVRKSLTRSVES